jgi:hypothetical protein
MKRVLLVALAFLGLIAAWSIYRSVANRPQQSSDLAETEMPPSFEEKADTSTLPVKEQQGMPTTPEAIADWWEKVEKARVDAMERAKDEWRAPINFWGKVVDESGMPVTDAQVSFGWTDLSPTEGYSRVQDVSDSNGSFALLSRTGKRLSVSVSKEGYYTANPQTQYFEYGDKYERFTPDSRNPVVFRLRKKGKAEPLIAHEYPGFAKIDKLHRDGTPLELDLINGTKVATGTGDVVFEFWSVPIEKTTKVFDWNCRISVPNGGIMFTEEEFNFLAPESGYAPQVEIDMPVSELNWRPQFTQKYYVRLKDGRYGRIEFYLLARNGVFRVKSAINPSGSRNLEFDRAIQPKPTAFE